MSERRRVVIVGGGLAGGLAAYRLATSRPDAAVTLIERAPRLGGTHTWCFHGADVASPWLMDLVEHSWGGYEVRFPGMARRFTSGYHALRSGPFHDRIMAVLGDRCRLATSAWDPDADLVIDARGAVSIKPCAWQKFHGRQVRTQRPHGMVQPLLMDATVPQSDGFRFLYVLPFSPHELLIEDTRYSDDATPFKDEAHRAIDEWLRRAGYRDAVVLGEEAGALAIPLHGAPAPRGDDALVPAGVRAGLFHPTTGYSVAEAVRFADWLAAEPELTTAAVGPGAARRAQRLWKAGAFFRRLNSMLFLGAAPEQRRGVLAQFYQRDAALISRFYAGRLTLLDRFRLISGRPPIPLVRGLRAFAFAGARSG